MKKYATISLFVFFALTVSVLTAGLISNNGSKNIQTSNPDSNLIGQIESSNGNTLTGIDASLSSLTLSQVELAKHDSSQSCWLLISGKIYDVTSFLNQHPGGAKAILPTCGTDATTAYNTKGKPNGSSHSSSAESMLGAYYVGDLNQTLKIGSGGANTSTQTKTTTQTKTAPAPTNTSSVTPTPTIVPATSQVTQTTLALTLAELVKHDSSQSCWLLISGKIYDVTNFIRQHPGGAAEILNTCGTDATSAFASRGGTGSHSSSATSMLTAYYIGDLNQNIITNTSNTNSATPTITAPNPTLPSNLGDDDEEDDD